MSVAAPAREHAVPRAARRGHTSARRLLAAVMSVVTMTWAAPSLAQAVDILDDFADIGVWKAVASDGVSASVGRAAGPEGPALRLDFDLAGTAGYAIARRALALAFPANYEISFYLRADAPINDFQLKWIDASGDNVWWFNRRNFDFPHEWQQVRIKKRQIEFAWGPDKVRTLRHAATVELVVAAGRGGGSGSVFVSGLRLRRLPPEPTAFPAPVAQASSALAHADPALALDGDVATAWRSDPAAGVEQALVVDFGRPREFGGLIVRWSDRAHASRYDVQFSDDGAHWRTMRSVTAANGGPDALALPESETRFVRLALHEGPGLAYGIAELEIKELAFGASANAFFQALARESPRGHYPRGFSGEQPYWTIVGIDGGHETGLLSEDGALELARGGVTVEPFVIADSKVVTWADVDPQPFLVDGYLPMPGVIWRRPGWELRVTTFAVGSREASRLVARYDVRNREAHPIALTLVLAIRPFQVNPPAQFLSTAGGVSPIRDIAWDGTAVIVNGGRKVLPLTPPDHAGMFATDAGAPPRLLAAGTFAGAREVHDPTGQASGLLAYRLTLAARSSRTIGLVVPLSGAAGKPKLAGASAQEWIARQQRAAADAWRSKLDRVEIRVPPAGQAVVNALRTSLAHILVTRDGPILRPGTRSYARSWIRDGAMMAESLLRLGHPKVAADYLRWYAPYQFDGGKVPCCVDERGADPVPEHDSAGQLLYLSMAVYRYTGDRALLEAMWPHLDAAARYLERLRQSERTEANLAPARRAFYGVLPASISHEGYAEKPVHSYWDDFWALKGYDAAVDAATTLQRLPAARQLSEARDEFRHDLAASLRATMTDHGIAYLPGSAELGDFDPTATTIAFAPDGDPALLPAEAVTTTYERYWSEFVDRRDGRKEWNDYTPYELRTVGTFVRLGWRDRAHELLAFFMADRRPEAWNQWPEVVGRKLRQPRFIGDLPHGWVASDFIRAALDLFAYERPRDGAMVIAPGVPPEWLKGPGIVVKNLRTRHGRLSFSLRETGGRTTLKIASGMRMPPGGLVFVRAGKEPPGLARINGKESEWFGTELRISELPAEVVIDAR
jgi:hypothetical protein